MRRPFRRAFTMIELLVVIGILVLLISILLPAISKAYNEARRNSDAADLAAISQALDAYRNDFGNYPQVDAAMASNTNNPYRGASILCWALVAPGPQGNPSGNAFGTADGYGDPTGQQANLPGPGFRVRGTQGTVHQSYLNLDRFKLAMVSGGIASISVPANGAFDDAHAVILDRFGQPILYFPANRAAVVTSSMNSYVGQGTYTGGTTPVNPATSPRYNTNDAPINQLFSYNLGGTFTPLQAMLRLMPGVSTQANGSVMQTLDPSGAVNANFLLWSAGPDGKFGGDDDVTNFR